MILPLKPYLQQAEDIFSSVDLDNKYRAFRRVALATVINCAAFDHILEHPRCSDMISDITSDMALSIIESNVEYEDSSDNVPDLETKLIYVSSYISADLRTSHDVLDYAYFVASDLFDEVLSLVSCDKYYRLVKDIKRAIKRYKGRGDSYRGLTLDDYVNVDFYNNRIQVGFGSKR